MIAALVAAAAVALPPVGAGLDYQLGGDYPLPPGVTVVSRDWHHGRAAPGAYNVCYVNAFQTQPGERTHWPRGTVLTKYGDDPGWPGEYPVDISTPRKRARAARFVGRWVKRCKVKGFDAVEYDNLDSFSRSHHLLTRKDNRRYAALLVAAAHAAGLAAAQKNWAAWDGTSVGYDFAVAEQCAQYSECASYADHYGRHVLAVEYRDKPFAKACRRWSHTFAVVRRDVDLPRHGVRRWC
jgi:hypothetical protein